MSTSSGKKLIKICCEVYKYASSRGVEKSQINFATNVISLLVDAMYAHVTKCVSCVCKFTVCVWEIKAAL